MITVQIRNDVLEQYLRGRDTDVEEVLEAALLLDYLRGLPFFVVQTSVDEHGRKLVTLDVSSVFIYAFGHRIMDLTIEDYLVTGLPVGMQCCRCGRYECP
jgi:hypothetical protein